MESKESTQGQSSAMNTSLNPGSLGSLRQTTHSGSYSGGTVPTSGGQPKTSDLQIQPVPSAAAPSPTSTSGDQPGTSGDQPTVTLPTTADTKFTLRNTTTVPATDTTMATATSPVQTAYQRKKSVPKQSRSTGSSKGALSIFSIVFFFVTIGLGIVSGFSYIENNSLEADKVTLEVKLNNLRQVEETGEAKATLSTRVLFYRNLAESRILWTNIVNSIMSAIPQSASADARSATILNVVGNASGTLTMSMESHPDSRDPFFDTAVALQSLADQSYLADVFIPSISVRQNQLGEVQLNYTLNAQLLFNEVADSLLDDEDLFSERVTQQPPSSPNSSSALADQVEALRELASESEPITANPVTPSTDE